jgi:hypothetical protein
MGRMNLMLLGDIHAFFYPIRWRSRWYVGRRRRASP